MMRDEGELDYWREEAERLREKMEDIALIHEAPGGLAIAKAIAYSALNKSVKPSIRTRRERIRNSLILALQTAMSGDMAERAVKLIEELIAESKYRPKEEKKEDPLPLTGSTIAPSPWDK